MADFLNDFRSNNSFLNTEVLHLGQEVLNKFDRNFVGSHNFGDWDIQKTPDLRLNSLGFRSDEFKKNHDKKHILFSGCSVTFGTGLLENEIWAKKLYNKINKENDCSGFFNLGLPGTSICDIVANIFKYIHNFNKPESIFIAIPNYHRRYARGPKDYMKKHSINENKIFHAVYKSNKEDEFSNIITIYSFHYLMFLEMFCKSNNINLYYFSYNEHLLFPELNRYFKTDLEDSYKKVAQFFTNNSDNNYAVYARDGKHFGEGFHDYWANFCHKLIQKGS